MRNILVVLLLMVLLIAGCQTREKPVDGEPQAKAPEQITEDSDAAQQSEKTAAEGAKETKPGQLTEDRSAEQQPGKTDDQKVTDTRKTEGAKEPEKIGDGEMPMSALKIALDYVPLPDINPEMVREKHLEAGQAVASDGRVFRDTPGYGKILKYQQSPELILNEHGNYILMQRIGGQEEDWLFKCNPAGDVILKQSARSLGWDDLDQLQYHQEMGIVIGGRQTDGRSFLACLNQENLTPRWIYPVWGVIDAFYTNGQAVVAALENSTEQKIRVIKLNSEGQELWCSEVPGRWPEVSITELSDGRVIAMRNNRGEKSGAVMDSYAAADGAKTVEILMDYYGELTPTDDGGFILVGYRPIKTVPQPVMISAIWFDYETVAAKYDKDFKLEWRKTYDSLKDTIGRDIIIPQPDGSIILTLSDAPF